MKTSTIAIICVGIMLVSGLSLYLGFPLLTQPKPEIDRSQKITDEISGSYSIVKYDWLVWSKTFQDSGGILTKMNTWEQFKESYRQSINPITIELDETHRIVWFKGSMNQAVYYEY